MSESMREKIAKDVLTYTTVDEDLAKSDRVFDNTEEIRTKVIGKLAGMLDVIDFTTAPSGESDTMGRMQPVNTLLGALKDAEAAAGRRVGMKMKLKDAESNTNAAEVVVEFLRKRVSDRLGDIDGPPELDAVSANLQVEFDESDEPVLEGELKTDPNDLV